MEQPENNTAYSVSVVIPAYNAQEHLGRAIDSVLGQTRCADEIIVVDDGSSDSTAEVAKQYGEKITYIYQDNAGPGVARNAGITTAKCDWIAFLDSDDEWLNNKLQLQCDLLLRNKDLVWTSGNYIRCLCNSDQTAPQSSLEDINAVTGDNDYLADFIDAFRKQVFGYTGTMMIRRNILLESGLFNTNFFLAEDIDLWFRLSYQHPRLGYVKEPIAVYHLDVPDSLSRKKQTYDFLISFVNLHLRLSSENNREDKWKPVARRLVTDWMRASLFDEDVKHIRDILKRYDSLLPLRTKYLFNLLTVFPRLTMRSCQTISAINQRLKIRRRLFHPTDRYN